MKNKANAKFLYKNLINGSRQVIKRETATISANVK